MRQALGLIEAVGLAAAIEAADTAIKSANVTLLGYEMTRGDGMITIKIAGDVGAVKAAVAAGVMAANRVNEVYSYHVIPRPHSEIDVLVRNIDRGPGRSGPPADEVPIGSDGDDGDGAPPVEETPDAGIETEDVADSPAPAVETPDDEAVADAVDAAPAAVEPVKETPDAGTETEDVADSPAPAVETPGDEPETKADAAGTAPAVAGEPVEEEPPVKPDAEAAAPARQRCQATTQAGTRCRNRARPGSDFCHIHARPDVADVLDEG